MEKYNQVFIRVYNYVSNRAVDPLQLKQLVTAPQKMGKYAELLRIFKSQFDPRFGFYRDIPEKSDLLQNYPNPFNPETWIPYQLKDAAPVAISIYSGAGQLVRVLALGYKEAGVFVSRSRAAYWNGKNEAGEEVASGTYFYSIQAGDYSATRKMVIAR